MLFSFSIQGHIRIIFLLKLLNRSNRQKPLWAPLIPTSISIVSTSGIGAFPAPV